MGVTAFLSMWINNSASANIMIPTALAIVSELQNHQQVTKQKRSISAHDSESVDPSMALENIVAVSSTHVENCPDTTSQFPTTDRVDYDQLKSGTARAHFDYMPWDHRRIRRFSHCCGLQCSDRWNDDLGWYWAKHLRQRICWQVRLSFSMSSLWLPLCSL